MRELWNTRDTLNFDLPVGELDGCRFGLKAMQDLLNQPGCDSFSSSPDASKPMAEFMRWATGSYMDFLASHVSLRENTAKLGLLEVDKVKNRLLVKSPKSTDSSN